MTQHGIPTLYIDYEMTQERQAERLAALFDGRRPSVCYYRASRPLEFEADRLETIIHEKGIKFVVVDSAVPASSGSANDAEAAAGVYGVLRRLGVGSLVVSHVTKASTSRDAKPEDATPYGSAFWWNLTRNAWHLRRAGEAEDGPRQTLGLFHSKHNFGKQPAIGLEIEFGHDRITITKVDAATVPEFAGSVSVKERMRQFLKRGPKTTDDVLAELEDVDPETVKRTIRRFSPGGGARVVLFQKVGTDMIALAETRRGADESR